MFATFFQIDEDLAELNQCYDHSCWSIDAVKGTQTAMMEQVAMLVRRVNTLEAHSGEQCLHIQELE